MLLQGLLSVFALVEVTSALPYPSTPAARSGIPISRRSLPLTRQIPRPDFLKKRSFEAKVGGYNVLLDGAPLLTSYTVPVEIDGVTYNLILDSGSSDLWVPTSNFTCYDATGAVVPLSACAFGGNFVNASSLLPLPSDVGQQHFNQTYGSGDKIMGDAGLANVTIGGVTVNNQEIVAASAGYWAHADGFNDGIIGFAGPLAEGMYAGPLSSGAQDGVGRQVFYENWIMRAVREGLFDPYFSLALNRPTPQQEQSTNATQDLGQLTLGGLPDIPLTNTTVTVHNLNIPLPKKLASSSASGNVTSTAEAVTNATITNTNECYIPQNCSVGQVQGASVWWTIPIDSWNFPGSDALNASVYETTTIIDSGTGLMTLPNEVAAGFAAAFDPPAVLNSTYNFYIVNCNATIPDFSVTIANVTFNVDKRDLIYTAFSEYLEPGQCVSSVVGSAAIGELALNLLGDRFLSNVVATHNLVTQEITITQRENY